MEFNKQSSSSQANSWIARPKPNPRAVVRLFCFPHSGAGASVFYSWQDSMPGTIEVCPVQLPGREARLGESLHTGLAPLVRAFSEAALPSFDRPFALFGHSMGALVSFEVARYLREHYSLGPVHLFVSGHAAPQVVQRDEIIHSLPEPEFWERLRRLNGTPEEVLKHGELRELILPILRADFAVCETYVYEVGELLDCPISALGGLWDPEVSREELEAWGELTRSTFSVRMFPGDHFYLNSVRSQVLRILARELNQFATEFSPWRIDGHVRPMVAPSS